jgi:hypothetical protein
MNRYGSRSRPLSQSGPSGRRGYGEAPIAAKGPAQPQASATLHAMGAVFAFYAYPELAFASRPELRADFELSVTETLEEVTRWLEEDDGLLAVYLHDGTVLQLVDLGEEPDVYLDLESTKERDLKGLLERLNAFQRQRGRPADVTDPIAFANEMFREEWEEKRLARPRWLSRWRLRAGPTLVDATWPPSDPTSAS